MPYRTKPIVIEANQWNANGDHPDDGPAEREGQVVRYFRHPMVPGDWPCDICQRTHHDHGWIDSGSFGVTVCPGDYVITGEDGQYGVIGRQAFEEMYEPVEP